MRARNLLRRYLNPDRERLIDERVHSDAGRQALKMMFVDGLSMMEASRKMDMPYSTFTDKYYHKWAPELFFDFGDE
jgi:hypothetical protein